MSLTKVIFVKVGYWEKKSSPVLEQAAKESCGVTVPGGVVEMCRYGT